MDLKEPALAIEKDKAVIWSHQAEIEAKVTQGFDGAVSNFWRHLRTVQNEGQDFTSLDSEGFGGDFLGRSFFVCRLSFFMVVNNDKGDKGKKKCGTESQ